jgi:hypothetical protein
MVFPKSFEYIDTIYNVSSVINKNAFEKKDQRLIAISSIITNYFKKILKDSNFNSDDFKKSNHINLVPFFEYVSTNNIEFYDFNNIKVQDMDVTKEADLERYVLSHIYYLTQK